MSLFRRNRDEDEEFAELRPVVRKHASLNRASAEAMTKRLERLAARTYRPVTPNIYEQKYWWVLGYEGSVKHIVGPYYFAGEADRILVGFDDGETFELTTRDKAKATSEIKAQLLEREMPPGEALKRVSHKLPMESLRERRRSRHGKEPEE